ncbi:hypothetical protein Agabi119p4_7971 [Agaricus bisporus var. burnettii]|uniref:cystathionine gamma-synthase n=1 Tax=Agaricus bisporus var. burnettii TaxID=192524 RepID=A0A8H7C667_AGABI|nr:hypothetical protein Agabi119p4_7971 [Agaricus bisporus var. burnettii]
MSVALGLGVPPHTPHAISVSLPTWKDNVGYEEGEKRVVDSMVNGYPRFFIHLSIRKLADICQHKYAVGNEECMLFPTRRIAEECRDFVRCRTLQLGRQPVQPRLVHLFICPQTSGSQPSAPLATTNTADLHIVLYPSDESSIAREFWQHTGFGISSRLAERCLSLLPHETKTLDIAHASPAPIARFPMKGGYNNRYSVKGLKTVGASPPQEFSPMETPASVEDLSSDHSTYVEERYGRNLPIAAAALAKRALRRRVAGTLIKDNWSDTDCGGVPCAGQESVKTGPSSRGVASVTEDDVYLFPSGMTAIWSAHQLTRQVKPEGKSVCFGFPYTDTLKVLRKWGPGAHFLGNGLDEDIDALEKLLESESKSDPSKPPVLALFAEFPSNPLLRSANLPRLRALADKYDFLIVVDETIGNFVNVDVLKYTDIVVSSLTKVFSGSSNVMGGSLVLNPQSRHYTALKSQLSETYEDTYFDEDAVYMERNSRDFKRRIKIIDDNTTAVCEFLRSRSVVGGSTSSQTAIKNVFYPKYITRENYDVCRVKPSPSLPSGGGFGGLFALTFTSPSASEAFFDALQVQKGPSLGTNFTLACPYTILAHYAELDWAEEFGVERGIVRVSVGMEERDTLLDVFGNALKVAEEAVAKGL